MFNFSDLQSEVKRRSLKNQSGSDLDTAVKNIINTSLFRLSRESLWRQLRRTTTLAITTSTEEFNLPVQVSYRMFMWHEDYGYPYVMRYMPSHEFYLTGVERDETGTPTHYRMWGEDMALEQPASASIVSIASSASSDQNIQVTVFGIVSGYPDYEVITTNGSDGTTSVNGVKSFTSIDRITKSSSSDGRITVTTNAGAETIAVLPVGDTTAGVRYRKIQLYPNANTAFTMNINYYKEPFRLVNAGDVHDLGQEFDEAIILLAVAKVNFESNKDEGDKFYALYKDELRTLRKHNIDKVDFFPKLGRPVDSPSSGLIHPQLSYSQVGSAYGPRIY